MKPLDNIEQIRCWMDFGHHKPDSSVKRSLLISSLSILLTTCAGTLLANDPLCFEAESADRVVAPVAVTGSGGTDDKGVSGGKHLEIARTNHLTEAESKAGEKKESKEEKKGEALYTFAVEKDGEYYLWGRAWWSDRCGNSVSMIIDDGKSFTFGQDGTYRTWHWIKSPPRIRQLKLTKGKHTLKIKRREDGVKLDQLLFTTDKEYVPVGIESITAGKSEGSEKKE